MKTPTITSKSNVVRCERSSFPLGGKQIEIQQVLRVHLEKRLTREFPISANVIVKHNFSGVDMTQVSRTSNRRYHHQSFGSLAKYLHTTTLIGFIVGAFSVQAAAIDVRTLATPSRTEIKDSEGRIRYIVDLVEDKAGRPASFADANSKITYQRAKAAQTVDDVTRQSGVMILGTTSFVGISFIAYLTETQVAQFSKDARVSRLTQDVYLTPSALWNSTTTARAKLDHGVPMQWACPARFRVTAARQSMFSTLAWM